MLYTVFPSKKGIFVIYIMKYKFDKKFNRKLNKVKITHSKHSKKGLYFDIARYWKIVQKNRNNKEIIFCSAFKYYTQKNKF